MPAFEALDRVAAAIGQWSAQVGRRVEVDWSELLTDRARLLGLVGRGRVSANGTCRLLRGHDGWMALNLPRPEDRAAVAAMVEAGTDYDDPWPLVEAALGQLEAGQLVARARLLGLPAARLGEVGADVQEHPWDSRRLWPATGHRPIESLRVVDLSSMWAGPLAAKLLADAGAHVIKVESRSRPDGARATPAFYGTLHPAGQDEVVVDLDTEKGRAQLHAVLDEADVIIESTRPRALEQLGAGPDDIAARPGLVWVSITGYGRQEPERNWVAFGDDAAVAAGLVDWEQDDLPAFCGDAVADPITGMVAAWAALEALGGGGGLLLDVPMTRCAAWLAARR